MDGFAHLHVASGFSMRYGASMPEELVERAAAHGQGALALTDRDGLYGAVRFATACGVASLAIGAAIPSAQADQREVSYYVSASASFTVRVKSTTSPLNAQSTVRLNYRTKLSHATNPKRGAVTLGEIHHP